MKEDYPLAFESYCKDNRIKFRSIENIPRENRKKILSVSLSAWQCEEKKIFQEKQREKKIDNEFDALERKYPNGITSWISQLSSSNAIATLLNRWIYLTTNEKEMALKEESKISKLEQLYGDSILSTEWESEQKEYTELCREKRDTFLKDFGCYPYSVKFDKVTRYGKLENGNYKIWEFFPYSYCIEDDLDYTYHSYIHENKKYVFDKNFDCSDETVDQITSFIKSLNDEHRDVSVYFRDARNECVSEDIASAYVPIYESLTEFIEESRIYDYPLDDAIIANTTQQEAFDKWIKNVSSKIVIIDYATQNEELTQFCEYLMTKGKSKKPLITYISLMKCFSREEMQSLIDKKKKTIEEERRKKEALEKKKQIILNASNSWDLVKGVRHYFFYYYYPTRFTDVTATDRMVRSMIYNFKDGIQHKQVCDLLVKKLADTYGDALDLITFVCIPASTRRVNKDRYEAFMEDVCSETGMRNGYEHVTIIKEKEPSHLGGKSDAVFGYDKDFFKDSYVVLFDDVVTRGHSLSRMKRELENNGATIVGAISIGRTYSDYGGNPRRPHPYQVEQNPSAYESEEFDSDDLPF